MRRLSISSIATCKPGFRTWTECDPFLAAVLVVRPGQVQRSANSDTALHATSPSAALRAPALRGHLAMNQDHYATLRTSLSGIAPMCLWTAMDGAAMVRFMARGRDVDRVGRSSSRRHGTTRLARFTRLCPRTQSGRCLLKDAILVQRGHTHSPPAKGASIRAG